MVKGQLVGLAQAHEKSEKNKLDTERYVTELLTANEGLVKSLGQGTGTFGKLSIPQLL
jgi:hypothetical protein